MTVYSFAGLRLDANRMEIAGPDGVRRAEPQVLDVLCHLVEHRDRLVTREDLLDAVWGDRFVSDSALVPGSSRRAGWSATTARARR